MKFTNATSHVRYDFPFFLHLKAASEEKSSLGRGGLYLAADLLAGGPKVGDWVIFLTHFSHLP